MLTWRPWVGWVIGIVCLTAVVAGAVLLLWPSQDEPLPAEVWPVEVDPTPRPGCPEREPDWPSDAVEVADDVVSLQWCPVKDSADGATHPPAEVLTTGLDRWVATFNALPPAKSNMPCLGVGAPSYVYVLAHADGSTQTIVGSRAGCGIIGGRGGASSIEELTLSLFTQQRSAGFTRVAVPHYPCDPWESLLTPSVDEVDRAVICGWTDGVGPTPDATIGSTQLTALLADLKANTKSGTEDHTQGGLDLQLLAVDGDRLRLHQTATGEFSWRVGERWYRWMPSPTTLQLLRTVLDESTGSPHPCEQGLARVLPVGQPLPDGPVRVWICGGSRFAPQDALTTRLDDLVAASQSPTGCARGEALVAEYADGSRVRLPAGADCPGNEPEQPSAAGQSTLIRTFVRLLGRQRADAGSVPPGGAKEAKFCFGPQVGLMPVSPATATGTVFCDFTPPGGTFEERHISGMLLTDAEHRLVVADLVAHSSKDTAGPGDDPQVVLGLVQPSGDRLQVLRARGRNAPLFWRDPTTLQWYRWTPSADVEKVFAAWRLK
ncbi:hypothetical protein [Aestuariimicrobium ganziense]|uniref:hypothetical protein n=1 Tax=Aestuariimicrobium ganziense TaxID=2773677 RepID=UPI001944D643|nr:hypothetical protein [Aestuariimicrobium ganziense]